MDSVLSTSTIFLNFPKSNPKTLLKLKPYSKFSLSANSSCNCNHTITITASINQNPFPKTLKTAVLSLAAALMAAKFTQLPVKAETLPPIVEQTTTQIDEKDEKDDLEVKSKAPLSKLMESSGEFVDNLRGLLHEKLDNGEDEEGLKILDKLVEAQPNEMEWKFLLARLLNEMGKTHESRLVFEDILSVNPLCFEALFENALLMDRCGDGQAVLSRLDRALGIAIDQGKPKEARDVRLIMAQMKFLQKNLDDALTCYDELIKEDPKDFRPYFCKGMIYSLLDRNAEAKQQFAKYKQLSPRKFEVEGYLRSPLSRIKLFDTSGSQNY